MEQYIQTYVERDVARLFPSLNRARFRQFTEMLAGLSGHVINYSEVARTLDVSQPTIRDYFYRTASGAEVDLILEGKFGLIPIEIKYNQSVSLGKIRAIKDFVREHELPYGIVIDNGESVRWITEEIVAIPFSFCI